MTLSDDGAVADSYGLGRIREVSARDAVQGNENLRFTPWLATYVDVLADVLGFGLRVMGEGDDALVVGRHVEVDVGGYFLDIRATDDAGRVVAIENQYGQADHRHLGQLIVYAAGVGADVLVWIAETFSEPHLEAIRWLNARTDGGCGVFAVRARFLQIGSSPPAPVFEVMARPSEWMRKMRELTGAARERWTLESFVSECVAPDRPLVQALVDRTDSSSNGPNAHLWFGARPNGSIYLHPDGLRYAPFMLWINSKGRAMVTGAWINYLVVSGHDGFRHVATLLGQDHTSGKASGVLLANLNLDELWAAGMASAHEVNPRGV